MRKCISHIAICIVGILLAIFCTLPLSAANRTYDGRTCLYWKVNPSNASWWNDGNRQHSIHFQKADDTWTDWVNPTGICANLAYYIVPAGEYKQVQFKSTWQTTDNYTGCLDFDSDSEKIYVSNFGENSTEATWSKWDSSTSFYLAGADFNEGCEGECWDNKRVALIYYSEGGFWYKQVTYKNQVSYSNEQYQFKITNGDSGWDEAWNNIANDRGDGSVTLTDAGAPGHNVTTTTKESIYLCFHPAYGMWATTTDPTASSSSAPAKMYGIKSNFMECNNHGILTMDYDEENGTYTLNATKNGTDTYAQLYVCDNGDCTDCNDNGWRYITQWSPLSGFTQGSGISFTYNSATKSLTAVQGTREPIEIRFTNPRGWANVYAYIYKYNDNWETQELFGGWPGRAMTLEEDGTYTITLDESIWKVNNLIINNGVSGDENDNEQTTDITDITTSKCYKTTTQNSTETKSLGGKRIRYNWEIDAECISENVAHLTGTVSVNNEGTQGTVTLTASAPSGKSQGATYQYEVMQNGVWTVISGPSSTTTHTVTEDGTYQYRVTISNGGQQWQATTEVKVKLRITIRVYQEDLGWTTPIKIHAWLNDGTYKDVTMTNTGGNWYEGQVTGWQKFNFVALDNNASSSEYWRKTRELYDIDDDICIIVLKDLNWEGKREYKVTTDCGLYHKYKSTATVEGINKTFYSNTIKKQNEKVSFYIAATPNVRYMSFNDATNSWTEQNISTGTTSGNVYEGTCSNLSTGALTGLQVYTGSFYVRSAVASGGWADYTRNAFTPFHENSNFPNEKYNHYYMCNTGTGSNLRAAVANDINPSLADTLPNFYTPQHNGFYNFNTTLLRYEYKPETNRFSRMMIQGSDINQFINVYGYNSAPVYNKAGTTQLQVNTENDDLKFSDVSDYVYQKNIQVKLTSQQSVQVVVRANYPMSDINTPTDGSSHSFYLTGTDANGNATGYEIMGNTTSTGTYNMRLIYDFKTNRLMALWTPQNTVNSDQIVSANMMLSRKDDNDATTISINSGKKVTGLKQLYSVLEITRSDYFKTGGRGKTHNYFYWISLPYDCYISDIMGLEGYGTRWTIQRYRGDLRALNGYWQESQTFWRNFTLNKSNKMQANRGYVVRLILSESDFREVTIDGETLSSKYLYFPSRTAEGETFTLTHTGSTSLTSTANELGCEISGREQQDSHWNVVGIPGLHNMKITAHNDLDSEGKTIENNPYYYYEWSWNNTLQKGEYTARDISDATFRPFQSYMVQYHGTLTWQPDIQTVIATTAPQLRAEETIQAATLLLSPAEDIAELGQGQDQTFIRMEEGKTSEWDENVDLYKEMRPTVNIYTIGGNNTLAGNCIDPETTNLGLGIRVAYAGDYTISMPQAMSDRSITLYDKEEDTEVVLDYSNYTVELPAGTTNNRFLLRFSAKQQMPTAVEMAESGTDIKLMNIGGEVIIDGVHDSADCTLYDTLGRTLYRGKITNGESIGQLPTGVYLLSLNNEIIKFLNK